MSRECGKGSNRLSPAAAAASYSAHTCPPDTCVGLYSTSKLCGAPTLVYASSLHPLEAASVGLAVPEPEGVKIVYEKSTGPSVSDDSASSFSFLSLSPPSTSRLR